MVIRALTAVRPVRLRVVSTHHFVPDVARRRWAECKWCGRHKIVHLANVPTSTYVCECCGVGMPNAAIYKSFHAEHCPSIGAQR